MADPKPLTAGESDAVWALVQAHPRYLNPPEIGELIGRSRDWANKVAKRLAKRGVLEVKDETRDRKKANISYRASCTPAGFAVLARAYLETLATATKADDVAAAGLRFLDTDYARANLTEDFARYVLSQRGIVMPRMVYLDAHGEETDSLTDHETLHVDLPVGASIALVPAAREQAVRNIEWTRTPQLRAGFIRWIHRHYLEFECQRLVYPMLALAQVSQGALRAFVGPWITNPDPVAKGWNPTGTRRVEHVLFEMAYKAVADLEATRAIPKGMDATWAVVCPEPVPVREGFPPALIEIQWRQEATIGVTAGFVAQRPVAYNQVGTWWRPRVVMGPVPPSQRSAPKTAKVAR